MTTPPAQPLFRRLLLHSKAHHRRYRLPTLLALILLLLGGCGGDEPSAATADGGVIMDASAGVDGTDGADGNDAADGDGGSSPLLTVPKGGFRAVFIDVGQGDATLLIADTGETLLIDGGRTKDLVTQRLVAMGLERLDAVLATHADADHIAGLAKAMELWHVKKVYWNGLKSSSNVFKTFFAVAMKTTLIAPKRGDVYKFGGIDLEFLHPTKQGTGEPNTDSLVVQTGCAGAWLLLTGDANMDAEASMLKAGVLSDIDVLKVGHHGSDSSTTQKFLDVTKPEQAIISAGLSNAYHHPSPTVVARLKAAGAKVVEVDTSWADDSVTMVTKCRGSYEVKPLRPQP